MAKRRKRKPHTIADRTRELTGEELELDKARKWYLREKRKPKGYLTVRRVAKFGVVTVWIDAGRPG